jgi:hypothetical protein
MVLTQHFFNSRKVPKNVSFDRQNGFDPAFFVAEKSNKCRQNGFDPAFFVAEKSNKC